MQGIVFNIQKYSVHDGPGIRTTVFLKGCPLQCWWCHNPESQAFEPELVFYKKRCIGCGACVKRCIHGAIEDTSLCTHCGECADVCYANAREMAGKQINVSEVMREIEKDQIFYEASGGGVTFSGGEPLAQPEFLIELLAQCKRKGIHTAIDTCGYASEEIIRRAATYADLFLYDLKGMDDQKHQAQTGVSNQLILENLQLLSALGKRLFIRMPIIPGINDDEANLAAAWDFIKALHGVEQINLLPYHHIGIEKYNRLGKGYRLFEQEEPSQGYMEEKAAWFSNKGIKVKIGG